ncbi:MAG: prepilin-type N-terminal cleavage/methylation domain-containing protein [Lachnospiraceae bacterium]|nr:prepilin-type N-terminal cleavage/methylation domain-containing protein [Lachnospiraceae bacterium]
MKQLKKMLKNNKGVTLVELIISTAILFLIITAFLSMVTSATKMFARGSRDLDVQEEAQSVTNQIESLLSDANLYAGQSGNEIFIVNEDLVHVISERSDGVYYTIYNFPATQDPTTENVKTLLTNNPGALKVNTYMSSALLSKRMTNLSLNTSSLDSDNVVYLSMSYKNQDRQIDVNQSVFLRNEPGSGGGHGHNDPVDNDFDAELFVLRYKTHNLKSEFGISSINSNGSTPAISGADASKYDVDISAGTIALKGDVATNASSAGGATITCTKGGQPYKIRLSFDPVSIGIDGATLQTASVRTQDVESVVDYIAAKGFDTKSSQVKYEISLRVGPNYQLKNNSGNYVDALSTGKVSITSGDGTAQSVIEGDKHFYQGGSDKGYFKGTFRLCTDTQSNHLRFRQTGQGLAIPAGAVPYYDIKVYKGNAVLASTTIKILSP